MAEVAHQHEPPASLVVTITKGAARKTGALAACWVSTLAVFGIIPLGSALLIITTPAENAI